MSLPVWPGFHHLLPLFVHARKRRDGYVYARYPEHPYAMRCGRISLHRIVMENHLDRYLEPEEEVHHRDLDKTNNRIENLELCASASDHMRKHYLQGTMGFWRKIEWPPETEMVKLLDQMLIGSVARELGVYRESVLHWCQQHGYEPKSGRYWQMKRTEELRPPKTELEQLVWQKSLPKIAKQFDVHPDTAGAWCRQLEIELPPAGHWNWKELPERDELAQWLKESTTKAAAHYRVNAATIRRWADHLELPRNTLRGPPSIKRDVDNQLFQQLYTAVMESRLAVWEAEDQLGLPVNSFRLECSKRGLPLATRHGRTGHGKKNRCSKQEVEEAAAKVRDGDATIVAAARGLGIRTCTLRKYCTDFGVDLPFGGNPKSRSKPVPPKDALVQQFEAGATCIFLARKYGVSRVTFRKWVQVYGLTKYTKAHKFAAKSKIIKPSRASLKRLLWKQPLRDLARAMEISRPTIQNWVKRYNLKDELPPRGYWSSREGRGLPARPNRKSSKRSDYSVATLKQLATHVQTLELSKADAGVLMGCSNSTFINRCQKHGIELPDMRNVGKPAPPKEELTKLVWKMSKSTLARHYGVTYPTLRKWIRQHSITSLPPPGYWRRRKNRAV